MGASSGYVPALGVLAFDFFAGRTSVFYVCMSLFRTSLHALVAKPGWACKSIGMVEVRHFSAVYIMGGRLSVCDSVGTFSFLSTAVLLFMIMINCDASFLRIVLKL